MKILILNWRDIKNPTGGGAEILTHELSKRWIKSGHQVTQFSSAFTNAKKTESIDGVQYIRCGKWWTVHFWAIPYYFKHKKDIDVIVDEVHWFPFFASIYAPKKTIALTCEVASKLLFKIFPYPIALIFLFIEKIYLYLYRKVPTMVISTSTKKDLIATGHDSDSITVLPMGFTLPDNIQIGNKEKNVTLVSIGRMNRQKGTLDVITAFNLIHKEFPKSKLWLVGSGPSSYKEIVDNHIHELQLQNAVTIWGFVSESKKFTLISRAHLLISASIQEGWGLTVPEAGVMMTPSVVYNIEGFRDIIDQGKTGILTNKNPKDLAEQTIMLLKNKSVYKKMQQAAYKKSSYYSWDSTAKVSLTFLKKYAASI